MKQFLRLSTLIFILAAGCTGAPFGRTVIPTARPLTSTTIPIATALTPQPTAGESTAAPASSATPTLTLSPTAAATTTPTRTPTQTASPTPTPEPQVAVVANDFTNVYSGPGLDYHLLAVLTAGFRVEVIGSAGNAGWLVIRLPRGAQGWVSTANVEPGLAVAGLPEIPAPSKPALTGTPVPAPQVSVSPNALAPDAKYSIRIEYFSPYERIILKVVFVENGSVVFKLVTGARADGSQEVILSTSASAAEGAYLLTATGDDGSYAETVFFVGPPPEFGSE